MFDKPSVTVIGIIIRQPACEMFVHNRELSVCPKAVQEETGRVKQRHVLILEAASGCRQTLRTEKFVIKQEDIPIKKKNPI